LEWGRKYKAIANIYAYVDDLIICNTKLSNGETGKIKNRGIQNTKSLPLCLISLFTKVQGS